jgi:hypothetical protein
MEEGGNGQRGDIPRRSRCFILHMVLCPPCFHVSVWHSLGRYSVVEQLQHLWKVFFASNLWHWRSWSVRAIAKFLVHTSTFSHVAALPSRLPASQQNVLRMSAGSARVPAHMSRARVPATRQPTMPQCVCPPCPPAPAVLALYSPCGEQCRGGARLTLAGWC